MKEKWHDREFVSRWDRTFHEGNPSRALQVDLLVSLVAEIYQPGKWIVDLGFGSGQVEESILKKRPEARIVGIDSSVAMIEMARERLAHNRSQMEMRQHDLTSLETITLPPGEYQIALSVQTLHHLPREAQRRLYAWVHKLLEPGGSFLIVDKRGFGDPRLSAYYEAAWNALEQMDTWRTGRSFAGQLEHMKSLELTEVPTVEEHLEWLGAAGFTATCLYLHLDRALLAARRK